MKKIITLPVLAVFLFLSCEKVINVDVPSTAPKLIIDATFDVFFNTTPVTANTVVKLSLSADYFDTSIPSVNNATVFITNLSDNTVVPFKSSNSDGNYLPSTTFIPQDDVEYELTVIHNNETYKGKATKVKSTKLISVVQGSRTFFTGKETEVEVTFKDNALEKNFYLFDGSQNKYRALEDKFFNGREYRFSFIYRDDEIKLPATVLFKMIGVSEAYYTYFRVLNDQSGQNSGGPFESVPTALLGNIVNTSNDNNFPLGYFHISETDVATISLVAK